MNEGQPTRKQAQVLGLLKQGLRPREIAKRMKVTPNAVYAHQRTLREKGLLPEPTGDAVEASPAPPAATNGRSESATEVAALAQDVMEKAAGRLASIDDRQEAIDKETERLAAEKAKLQAEADELTRQRDALAKAL